MHHTQSNSERNATCIYADMPVVRNRFATELITAVKPTYQQLDEEALYALFEQAISDRVVAVSARLRRISGPLTNVQHAQCQTTHQSVYVSSVETSPATMPLEQRGSMWSSLLGNAWQRSIILLSLALMLMIVGFDLMGILVLHIR